MTTVSQRCSRVAGVPNNNICFKNDKNDVKNARTHSHVIIYTRIRIDDCF